MSAFFFELSGEMLFWHLIQVTIVALLVWPLARFAANKNAHVAHLLWALALIKCVTPPLIAAPTSPFCWIGQSGGFSAAAIETRVPALKEPVSVSAIPLPVPHVEPTLPILHHTRLANEADVVGVARLQPPTVNTPAKSGDSGHGKSLSIARRSASQIGVAVAIVIWIGGAVVMFLIAGWRLLKLHIEISKGRSSESVQQLADTLRDKLGVRQKVKVRVLPSALGPAVTGFFRPTILLPHSIVEVLDQDELEPVIAHELVHFRRGDLGWAVLQSVCSRLFWFHPLVHLAVRELTIQSERCCDEQTIAGLHCSPGQYAKGLLSVLECKVRLQAIPALPGVRAVDITSNRLERIMNFKDEMKTRTPVLAWLVFVISGLVLLPGAAWVVAQDSVPEKEQTAPKLLEIPEGSSTIRERKIVPPTGYVVPFSSPDWQATVPPTSYVVVADGKIIAGEIPLVIRAYEIASLRKRFAEDMLAEGFSRTKLELVDLQIFKGGGSGPPEEKTMEAIFNGQVPKGLPKTVKLGGDEPLAKVVGDFLFLLWPEYMQDEMQQRLESVRKFGFRQIQYHVSLANVSKETLEDQKFKWSLLGADKTTVKAIAGSTETNNQASHWPTVVLPLAGNVQMTGTQHHAPVYVAEVNSERIRKLKSTLKQQRTMPTGTTFSGCWTSLDHGIAQQPFVVGVKRKKGEEAEFEPVIRLFEVGTKVDVQGKHNLDDSIDLSCKLSHSSIVEVGIQEGLLGDGITVQVPKLDTLNIDIDYQLPKGSDLVVATPIESAPDRFRVLLLDCEALALKNELAHHQSVRTVSYDSDVNPFDRPTTPKSKKLKISTSVGDEELKYDSWAVKAILKEMGFEAELSGHMEVKLKPDAVELTGKDIVIEFAHEKYSADSGTLTFVNKQLKSLTLVGEVECDFNGLPFQADKVQLVSGTEEVEFSHVFSSIEMSGNVRMNGLEDEEGMSLSTDYFELKSDFNILLKGNSRLEMKYGGVRQVYTGDAVSLNDKTEQLEISGKGTMTIQKGGLKEAWKGEEIKASLYGLGVIVDGEAQDFDARPFMMDEK